MRTAMESGLVCLCGGVEKGEGEKERRKGGEGLNMERREGKWEDCATTRQDRHEKRS